MDALAARALLFQRKLSIQDVTWSIPGVEALDNQLAIIELTEEQLQHARALAKQPDDTISSAIAGAAAICKSLVLRETKERIFSDGDVESVVSLGHSVLSPLNSLVEQVSALSESAIEAAKKNLPKTPANVSATSSPENLVEETPSAN